MHRCERGKAVGLGHVMAVCVATIVVVACPIGSAQAATAPGARSASVRVTWPHRPSFSAARRCATSQPARWMGCITAVDPEFAGTPLSEVAIPGAHDSGTFDLDENDFDTQSGSDCTSYTPIFTSVASLVKQWSEAQNIDYTQQLNDGVRYFDVRIAYTGNEEQGWRIVHTQFSNDPLQSDLASIASWAKAHPTEVVVVDVQHLCYDNSPTPADDAALWSEFSPLAPVSYDPSQQSVATATLHDITWQRGGGHNVVVMLPSSVLQPATLLDTYHVHATFVTTPGAAPVPGAPTPSVPEAYAWASSVSPAAPSDYVSANQDLAQFPLTYSPPLGSLRRRGLYQSQLIYSLNGSNIAADLSEFEQFGGLIPALHPHRAGTASPSLPAWELGLWTASYDRNDVLAQWGHRLNVVVSDGVQYGGYVPAVVEQNAGF